MTIMKNGLRSGILVRPKTFSKTWPLLKRKIEKMTNTQNNADMPELDEHIISEMMMAYIDGYHWPQKITNYGSDPQSNRGMKNVLALLTEKGYSRPTPSPVAEGDLQVALNGLREIKEIYIGTEGGVPETAYEGYLLQGQKQMYEMAAETLKLISAPLPVAVDVDALKVEAPNHLSTCLCTSCMKSYVINKHIDHLASKGKLSAPLPGDDLAGMIELVANKTHASVSFVRLGDKDWTVISGGHYTGVGVDPKSAFTDALNKMGGAPVKTLRED